MTDESTVLFLAHTGQVSGAEKVLLDLIDEATRRGHATVIACPAGPLADRLPDTTRHVRIDELGLGGQRGAARGIAAIRMVARWVGAARAVRTIARAPGTATVVNSLFALPVARFARPARGASWLVHDTMTSLKQRVVVRFARPAVRVAVSVSEATAEPLRKAGLPVVVSHNGVPWPVPRFGGALHSPPVVGMLALLTPWKGHRVLLDAVAMLPDVRVELAGEASPVIANTSTNSARAPRNRILPDVSSSSDTPMPSPLFAGGMSLCRPVLLPRQVRCRSWKRCRTDCR